MNNKINNTRILSIDIVRGIVMSLMVIDHVRHSFTGASLSIFDSNSVLIGEITDLSLTTPTLFAMRWITHLCAPSFVFLAGVSIFFWSKKYSKEKSFTQHFVIRGILLIFIDLMLNARSIFSHEGYVYMGVLWAIGMSMILFPLFVKFSSKFILFIIFIITITSNLFTFFSPSESNEFLRIMLLKGTLDALSTQNFNFFIGYPVLPWLSVMLFGFIFAKVFTYENPIKRQQILILFGTVCILAFILIQVILSYANLLHLTPYEALWQTIASFINITKYPPSLLFLLITLGIMFYMLAIVEKFNINPKLLLLFGTTSLFFYCIHLFYIKLATVILKQIYTFFPFIVKISFTPTGVIAYSLLIIAILYPTCYFYKKLPISKIL